MIKGEKYAAIIGLNPSKGARSPKLWNKAYERLNQKTRMVCIDINDANYLDERLWNEPEYGLISHNLVTNKPDDLINIGYPGTKFVLGSDLILNLSPDIPKNLDGYKNFIQLVIMDGADLRQRAANTWSKCKDLGLKTKFVESI